MTNSKSEYWIGLYFSQQRKNAYKSTNSDGVANSLTEAAINSALSASGESLNNYYADKMAAIANKSTGEVPTVDNTLSPKGDSAPTAGSTPSGASTAQTTNDFNRVKAQGAGRGGGSAGAGGGAADGGGGGHYAHGSSQSSW